MPDDADGPMARVSAASDDYDVLVIGSGFGGSVAALRLTEKGYRVGVLEAGRRFEDADFPRTAIIGLTMQALDNSITVYPRRTRLGRLKLTSRQGHGAPNPAWIPSADEAMRRTAAKIGGFPLSSVGEMVDIPMTAHFIGGCVIGESADSGVVDAYQRMYGHPGLHVVDGSAISANLGVNPALTITAQAERAMALWPNRGEADPRPALGAAYRRLAAVEPRSPAVPPSAPAALRLPPWAADNTADSSPAQDKSLPSRH
jgi:choline dehydrogenase-like flavoprotein